MIHATLWKRILNEGYEEEYDIPGFDIRIIKSTIIVDSRPYVHDEESRGIRAGDAVAFPFPTCWIEGTFFAARFGNCLWGCLVESGTNDSYVDMRGFFSVTSAPVRRVSYRTFELENGKKKEDSMADIAGHVTGDDEGRIAGRISMSLAWDTLLMLSCKNVSLSPRENDPKQVRRAMKRHGGNPDSYRYHVLVVKPPGARSDHPGEEIGNMPRHVCRGHFAEYGPEFNKGLLFGKYAGRYFIPPCIKGDKKNGVVEKDYEIGIGKSPIQP